MSENTNENPKKKFSLEMTRAAPLDEVESAKILFQEGLFEEAKKKLYQILIVIPNFKAALVLLEKIQKQEERSLLETSGARSREKAIRTENPDHILKKLESDLGIQIEPSSQNGEERWASAGSLSAKEHFDLGVAFFQMDCFGDAIRELKKSERKIRQEQTFLGELGVSVVALLAESQVKLGRAFEAKSSLESVLTEPDLKHEEKIILFYVMGLIEEDLGHSKESKGWFQKVLNADPDFRDVQFRLKQKIG